MKRRFLVWLDTLPHKPEWLKKKINMAYWTDLLNIQEEKKKKQTEYEKELNKLEEKVSQYINNFKKSLLATNCDGGVKMYQLSQEEANKKMISILEQWGLKPEEIPARLRFLGFKVEEKPSEEPNWKAHQYTDPVTKQTYNLIEKDEKITKPKETTMVLKEISRTEEKKSKRRTANGKRKTTAKAHA